MSNNREIANSVSNDLMIAELISKNITFAKIKRYAEENLKIVNFEEVYKNAQLIIFNQNNIAEIEFLSRQLAVLDDLYDKSYKEGDRKECREIVKTKTEIYLMYKEFINTL